MFLHLVKLEKNNKCPPWAIRAKTIEHNAAKKTIYYKNAVMKIYDFPVFYFPKFFILIQQLKDNQVFSSKIYR